MELFLLHPMNFQEIPGDGDFDMLEGGRQETVPNQHDSEWRTTWILVGGVAVLGALATASGVIWWRFGQSKSSKPSTTTTTQEMQDSPSNHSRRIDHSDQMPTKPPQVLSKSPAVAATPGQEVPGSQARLENISNPPTPLELGAPPADPPGASPIPTIADHTTTSNCSDQMPGPGRTCGTAPTSSAAQLSSTAPKTITPTPSITPTPGTDEPSGDDLTPSTDKASSDDQTSNEENPIRKAGNAALARLAKQPVSNPSKLRSMNFGLDPKPTTKKRNS